MEEDKAIGTPSVKGGLKRTVPQPVSRALRSLLFAVWGIFLLFVGLNPLGLFTFLYVLVVPAWFLGCAGLFYGVRSLLKLDGSRLAAIVGIILNALIVLLPLYPFVMSYYTGTAEGKTADLPTSYSCKRPGERWKAGSSDNFKKRKINKEEYYGRS